MVPFSWWKNNKVILVLDCGKWEQGFFILHLLQLQNVSLNVNMSALVFVSIKHVSGTFSWDPT